MITWVAMTLGLAAWIMGEECLPFFLIAIITELIRIEVGVSKFRTERRLTDMEHRRWKSKWALAKELEIDGLADRKGWRDGV